MAVKQGDFLLVNYTLKVKESGDTVDTTYDTVAKEAHLHREDSVYGPKFIILGEGWLPKGLEESLVGVDQGKQTSVELTPEKGFGARDPAKMRLVPLRRFRDKEYPVPGAQVEFDGRPAVVRAVGAGRVQVDYNHPLAGRTLIYDISVEKILEDENEKITNIISRRIPEVEKAKFRIDRKGDELSIEVPEEAFYLKGLEVAKRSVSSDLQKYLPDLETITFREVFKREGPKPEKPPEPTPAATKATPPLKQDEKAKPGESTTEPKAKRKRAPAKRSGTKTSQKRAMMGSESQR